ncbi:uncharacterized protein LAJ45_00773 [Morchella importuna]|uniref:uncharacterized protein n=1 Tax=Morchella importuna TaxID=1174673 RepID=UPI001E8EF087|nr:uncharacterized protein LAJ45_00773 [Morchella importuna]KAH8155763.1 hypothetical protein LAJ45_00773 [Morchella importuna]
MPCLTGFEDKPLPPYSPQNPFYQGQIENPWTPPAQRWAAIKTIKTVIQGAEITDDVLAECVKLFNANFGTWSKLAKNQRNKGVPGSAVEANAKTLRENCVPCEETTLARIYVQDKLVGYAFATRWPHHERDGDVCWITQVVVDKNYRGVGLATALLSKFKTYTDVLYGIMSHHPAVIMALKRAILGTGVSYHDLSYTQAYARDVLQGSIIETHQDVVLRGTLFNQIPRNPDDDGIVCCVETKLMLTHDDALSALRYLEQEGKNWDFGQLHHGLEFIALIENRSCKQKQG